MHCLHKTPKITISVFKTQIRIRLKGKIKQCFVTILYSWSANGFSNQGEKGNKTEPYRILLQNNMQKKIC